MFARFIVRYTHWLCALSVIIPLWLTSTNKTTGTLVKTSVKMFGNSAMEEVIDHCRFKKDRMRNLLFLNYEKDEKMIGTN